MIVGQHERTICYVDCFAGPWEEQGDDFEDTSIARSLNIIRKCRDGLNGMGKTVQFRALFVEQKSKSFRKLQDYLISRKSDGIDTHALNGSFHELLQDILSWCGRDGFVFFFVDPKGWKNAVELPTLTPLLLRPNSEFLINFMYDFLSRTVPQPVFKEEMCSIFGIVPEDQGKSPEQREEYLLTLYRNNLKQAGDGQPRTACVKVLKPTRDRTLYHLVYLTRHPKGIVVFMEASEKLELVQKKAREQAKQDERVQRSKQQEMFAAAEQIRHKKPEQDLAEVEEYWLNRLTSTPVVYGMDKLADILEETGWFVSDLQKALGGLARKGLVKNLDGTPKRRSKFVYFDANHNAGERLIKVTP
jgi:three-Cys-motif partner protein